MINNFENIPRHTTVKFRFHVIYSGVAGRGSDWVIDPKKIEINGPKHSFHPSQNCGYATVTLTLDIIIESPLTNYLLSSINSLN